MNQINDTNSFIKTVKYNLLQCNCQHIAQYIAYGFSQLGCGEITDLSNTYNGMYSEPINSNRNELLAEYNSFISSYNVKP